MKTTPISSRLQQGNDVSSLFPRQASDRCGRVFIRINGITKSRSESPAVGKKQVAKVKFQVSGPGIAAQPERSCEINPGLSEENARSFFRAKPIPGPRQSRERGSPQQIRPSGDRFRSDHGSCGTSARGCETPAQLPKARLRAVRILPEHLSAWSERRVSRRTLCGVRPPMRIKSVHLPASRWAVRRTWSRAKAPRCRGQPDPYSSHAPGPRANATC